MNDSAKPIRIMVLIALILQVISTVIFLIVHLFPKPFLTLFGSRYFAEYSGLSMHPLLFAAPLLRLIVIAGFGYMLLQECKKPTSFSPTLTVLILAVTVVLGLASSGLGLLSTVFISRLYSAEQMGAVSVLNTVTGWTGIITAPVFPLFTAAAGFNWCRYKTQSPDNQVI